MTGIYKITNTINNHVYIGQAENIDKRIQKHINALVSGYHVNKHLQNAWNKYGANKFTFSIIEECELENLTEREQYWIDYYGGIDSINTYNVREASNSGTFNLETKNLISEKLNGHAVSEQTRNKLRMAMIGKSRTDEVKKKISNTLKGREGSLKGKHLTEEHKQKISESMKGMPCNNPGYRHNEETKKRISEAMKGKPHRKWTDEEKKKQSERLKGRTAWNKGISMKNRKPKSDN